MSLPISNDNDTILINLPSYDTQCVKEAYEYVWTGRSDASELNRSKLLKNSIH